ncbi:hypothetical protein MANI_029153 [Metarhizium anisopliae]|nr:hypothetical protein MANI_029153 [Metarhizium anisopliae]
MNDPFRDHDRNTWSLRLEIEDRILSRLHGFYFAAGDTILGSKHEDKALIQELCPENAGNNITLDVTNFILRTLVACSRKWHMLHDFGPLRFWNDVTTLGRRNSNIHIRPMNTRNLITALIKARQRYVLRQSAIYPDFVMETDLKLGSDTAAQAILERVLGLQDPITFSGDIFRSPLCSESEKRDLLKHAINYGPVKQISGKKYQLAQGAPQNLHPISDLARKPAILNSRGFLEQLVVGPTSPTEGVANITAPNGGRGKSRCVFVTPTRCKRLARGKESPLLDTSNDKSTQQSKKRVKTSVKSDTREPAAETHSPVIAKCLKSPSTVRSEPLIRLVTIVSKVDMT